MYICMYEYIYVCAFLCMLSRLNNILKAEVNNIPKSGVNNIPKAGVNSIPKAGVDVIPKTGMKRMIRRARFTTYDSGK